MTDAEQIAVTKLWYVAKHLNISDPPQPTDLLTAVALVEHAAEWARMHIERRGKENDELREQAIKLAAGQFAAHDQSSLLAEAVRQARLDEAKWWDKNSNAEDEAASYCAGFAPRRPGAPAGGGKEMKRRYPMR